MRAVRLYGNMGTRFGRMFNLDVASAAEAVRALCVLLPGFEEYLARSRARNETYAVFYGDKNIGEEELTLIGGDTDIRIAPVIIGAKRGGIFQTIFGAALIAVGAWINIASGGTLSFVGNAFINTGIAMALGGVVQLLSPAPTGRASKDRPENTPSATFNGPINTQAQGHPVPVLYGELIVGSAVISAGISAVDQAFVPDDTPGAGSGGGGGGGSPIWQLVWDKLQ